MDLRSILSCIGSNAQPGLTRAATFFRPYRGLLYRGKRSFAFRADEVRCSSPAIIPQFWLWKELKSNGRYTACPCVFPEVRHHREAGHETLSASRNSAPFLLSEACRIFRRRV